MTAIKSALRFALLAAGVSIAAMLFFAIATFPIFAAAVIDGLAWSLATFVGGIVWLIAVSAGVSSYVCDHPTLKKYLPPMIGSVPFPPFPKMPE
jgi:hypothetical protein